MSDFIKPFVQLILNKEINNLPLADLFSWGEEHGLKGKVLSWSEDNFEIVDEAGEQVLFGSLDSDAVDLCVMLISKEDTEQLNSKFEELYKEMESLFFNSKVFTSDGHSYGINFKKWVVGTSAIWLYQEARDPMNGSELAISLRRSATSEPY